MATAITSQQSAHTNANSTPNSLTFELFYTLYRSLRPLQVGEGYAGGAGTTLRLSTLMGLIAMAPYFDALDARNN